MHILASILAALPPTIAAIAAAIVALRNDRKITEIRVKLNSRLTELLEMTRIAAHAEGRAQERKDIAHGLAPTVNTIGTIKED